ncbi:MAG: hypothetical protein ACOCQD_00015 [archaeon]
MDEIKKIENMINKKWYDQITNTDDILMSLAKLQIKNNETIEKLAEQLGGGQRSGFQNYSGATGTATTSADKDEKISVVTYNDAKITGIARDEIVEGEPIIIGGGSPDKPYIYSSSQIFRGRVSGSNSLGKSEIDEIGRLISTTASDANFTVILNNPTFNTGTLDGWSYSGDGKVEIDKNVFYTDDTSAKITSVEDKTFDFWNTKYLRVAPEQTLNVSGYFRKIGDLDAYILVRYFNANKKLVTTNYDYESLFRKPITDELTMDKQWVSIIRNPVAPANASYAQVGVRVISKNDSSNIWVDNVSAPIFTPLEKQFYYTTDKYTKQYVLPGENVILHEGNYSIRGNIVEVFVDVNNPDAILEFELDGLTEEYYLRMFNHDLVWRPNTISLYNKNLAYPNERDKSYQYVWESPNMFPFNYRMKVVLKNPQYLPKNAQEEVLATGDGSTSNFTGTLDNYPIYTTDTKETYLSITDGVEVFIDNGDGTLTGSEGGSGTINYETGDYDITFNSDVDDGTSITAIYTYLTENTNVLVLHTGYVNKQIYL